MPITHAIWTVDPDPQPLPLTRLPSEAFLEDMIIQRPEILSGEWMLIGSQAHTGFGDRIDLLAIAPDASLVLIELQPDPTPPAVGAPAPAGRKGALEGKRGAVLVTPGVLR